MITRVPHRASLVLTLLLAVLVGPACVTLDEPKVAIDAPVLLRPAANELRGAPKSRVLTSAKETVRTEPMDTRFHRRLAMKTGPAVVSLFVKTATPVRVHLLPIPFLPGIPARLPGRALGSGFFIHSSGYIMTNNHVISTANEIRGLTDDETELELEVIARDPVYDLALLRVVKPKQKFPVLPMGDSDLVGVGDGVIAVGNPLGLGHTVTWGIISQTNRNLQGVEPEDDVRVVSFIQTDTAINPGSSGGPLITLSGAWIGVNTAGVVTAQNIGFAVPSKQVAEFIDGVLAGKGDQE